MAIFGNQITATFSLKDNISGGLKNIEKNLDNTGSRFNKLAGIITTMAGAAGIGALGKEMLRVAGDFEQSRIAFNTLTGSAEKADTLIKDMFQFAKSTPFELSGLKDATQKLLAYGFTSEDVLDKLRVLGDLAAGVGTDKLPQLILAFGQVKAAGKLTGMELRQFNETGIPLIEALAKHFGVASTAIQEMVSDGKVGFHDVEIALQKLTGEGGKFENLMAKQSGTLNQMVSNLGDAWTQFLLGEGNKLIEWAKSFVGVVTAFVQNDLPVWANRTADLITFLTENKAILYGIAGAITAYLIPAIAGATTAIGSLVLALGPIGLASVGVGVLVGKIQDLKNESIQTQEQMALFVDQSAQLIQSYSEIGNSLGSTFGKIAEGQVELLQIEQQYAEKFAERARLSSEYKQIFLGLNADVIMGISKEIDALEQQINTTKDRQDAMIASEESIFRETDKFAALKAVLSKEEFDNAVNLIKERKGVNDDVNQALLQGEIRLTDDKLKLIKDYGVNSVQIMAEIAKSDALFVQKRLDLAKESGIKQESLINALLKFNAQASDKEVDIFLGGLTQKQKAMQNFDANLRELLKPKIQKIGIAIQDLSGKGLFGALEAGVKALADPNKTFMPFIRDLKSGFSELGNSINSEISDIDVRVKTQMDALNQIGGIAGGKAGGGAKDAKKEVEDLAKNIEKYHDLVSSANEEINKINESHIGNLRKIDEEVQKVNKEYEENVKKITESIDQIQAKMAELDEKQTKVNEDRNVGIAEAIVAQDELIKRINQEITLEQTKMSELQKRLAAEQDAENKKKIEKEITDGNKEIQTLEGQLAKEMEARTANADLEKQLENEIAEIKRFNNLTDLEQKIEQANADAERRTQEIEAERTQLEEKMKLLEDDLANREIAHQTHLTNLQNQRDGEMQKFNAYLEARVAAWNRHLTKMQSDLGVSPDMGGVPSFQKFATGGVVTQPTLGLIGEGKYNEAVIPLPDGKNVPVKMMGDSGAVKNITLNITGPVNVRNDQDLKNMARMLKDMLVRELDLAVRGVTSNF